MKSRHTLISFAALAVVSLTAPLAGAHDGGFARGDIAKAHVGGAMGFRGMIDPAARLAELKGVLNLTSAQLPAWNAFEETSLRFAGQAKQIMETARANNTPRADVRAQMRAFRETNKAEMVATRKALFASLTETQKAAAKDHFKEKMRGLHDQQRGLRG